MARVATKGTAEEGPESWNAADDYPSIRLNGGPDIKGGNLLLGELVERTRSAG